MRTLRGVAALVAILALAGCAAPIVKPQACPAPVPYSAADQQALAAEMTTLKGTIVDKMLDDYHQERRKLAACRK